MIAIKIFQNRVFKAVCIVLLLLYLFLLAYLTLLSPYYGRESRYFRSVNIIPFSTISFYLSSYSNFNSSITNLAGNIIAFMPLGFLLPLCFIKLKSLWKMVTAALFVTLIIETFQYILCVGASDIDDVVLNVFGGVLGYLVFTIIIWCANKLFSIKT